MHLALSSHTLMIVIPKRILENMQNQPRGNKTGNAALYSTEPLSMRKRFHMAL